MYKLLLVDDDPLICEGMKYIINWANYGIEVKHTAFNGSEALEIIHHNDVDIMITDIHMPNISGVELISEARRYQPEIKCFVLSGYDDYQYVRNAMRAGAIDYLLKPIIKEELEKNIVDLLSSLEKQHIYRQAPSQLLLERSMQRLLDNAISPKERLERLEILKINTNPNTIGLGLIKCKEQPNLIDICMGVCRPPELQPIIFCVSDDVFCFLYVFSNPIPNISDINSYMQQCVEQLQSGSSNPVYAAVSQLGNGWRQVPSLYQQACFLLDYLELDEITPATVFQGNANITEYPINIAEVRLFMQSISPLDFYHFLEKSFATYDIQKVDCRANCLALSILRKCLAVASDLLLPNESLLEIRAKTMKNIASANSLQELIRNLYPLVNDLYASLTLSQKKEYSQFVKQTLSILEKESEDSSLSLRTIADRLYVNATYLGKQFKNETGAYFNDYLAKIRVRNAESLLVTTDLNLSEIAQLVGFSSENYFISVFKKNTSVTPGSIRRIVESYR